MAIKRCLWLAGLFVAGLHILEAAAWGQPPAAADSAPAAAMPFPPLSADEQRFLDQVLTFWERRSQGVERYRCSFRRWDYDPVFGPPAPAFKTYSEGAIKFEAPDKGLFKVEKLMHFAPPEKQGEAPKYVQREGDFGEFWICDGESVFEHDHKNKQLIQRELPPQLRGRAIVEGPLPFLFGANAERIKQRYWIRPLPVPQDVQGEYWLEAFPKTRQDAANYQKVHVIIAQADFLPKGLVVFDRNFDPQRNPARSTFTFENREVNWSIALQQLNIWRKEFYQPAVPFGWKKVVEPYDAPPEAEPFAPAATADAGAGLATPDARR